MVKYIDGVGLVASTDTDELDGPTGDWHTDVNRPPLGSVVAMVLRSLVDHLHERLDSYGVEPLRPSSLYILGSLFPDGLTVTRLAETCQVSKQAISQVLLRLESVGLVEKGVASDRRTKIVRLTADGEAVLAAAERAWADVDAEWTAVCGDEDTTAVRSAILAFLTTYGDWRQGDRPRLRPVW